MEEEDGVTKVGTIAGGAVATTAPNSVSLFPSVDVFFVVVVVVVDVAGGGDGDGSSVVDDDFVVVVMTRSSKVNGFIGALFSSCVIAWSLRGLIWFFFVRSLLDFSPTVLGIENQNPKVNPNPNIGVFFATYSLEYAISLPLRSTTK